MAPLIKGDVEMLEGKSHVQRLATALVAVALPVIRCGGRRPGIIEDLGLALDRLSTHTPEPRPSRTPRPLPTYTPYPSPEQVASPIQETMALPTPYPTYTLYPLYTAMPEPSPTVAQASATPSSGARQHPAAIGETVSLVLGMSTAGKGGAWFEIPA